MFQPNAPMCASLPAPLLPNATEAEEAAATVRLHAYSEVAIGLATRYSKGTVLVIGANRGDTGTDPSWRILTSPRAAHLHKLLVEPIPSLYRSLRANLAGPMKRDGDKWHTQQVAISNISGSMPMYCLGMDPVRGPPNQWPVALRRAARWDTAQKNGRGWWSEICSLSTERFFAAEDIRRDFPYSREERQRLLRRHVHNSTVRVVTVAELLGMAAAMHLPPVRHVQIDAEGHDDVILASLPFGEPTPLGGQFRPATVVFEHVLLSRQRSEAACSLLRQAGYTTCRENQNIVGFALPGR